MPRPRGCRRSTGCTPRSAAWSATHWSACRGRPTIGPEATVALLSATVVAPLAAGDASAFAALSAALGLVVGLVCAGIGLLRLGFLARLLSRPVLAGYLVGTGVTMILSQADKLLGVDVSSYDALTMAGQLWQALGDANMVDLAIGVGGRRWHPAPASLRTDGPRVPRRGGRRHGRDRPAGPGGDAGRRRGRGHPGGAARHRPCRGAGLEHLGSLLLPAVGIAFLVFADSGITARALARRTGDAVDQDRHMLGMGAAGVAAGLVSGFAVNASTSRSFAIADAGGRSQVVGLAVRPWWRSRCCSWRHSSPRCRWPRWAASRSSWRLV